MGCHSQPTGGLIGRVLTFCKGAVGIFYLQPQLTWCGNDRGETKNMIVRNQKKSGKGSKRGEKNQSSVHYIPTPSVESLLIVKIGLK